MALSLSFFHTYFLYPVKISFIYHKSYHWILHSVSPENKDILLCNHNTIKTIITWNTFLELNSILKDVNSYSSKSQMHMKWEVLQNIKFWEFLLKGVFLCVCKCHYFIAFCYYDEVRSFPALTLHDGMRKTFIKVHATAWFTGKSSVSSRMLLVHILALPLTGGDLGEVTFLYQLEYFQKPPSSLLESSGNLSSHKCRGRAGFKVGHTCGSGSQNLSAAPESLIASTFCSDSFLKLLHIHIIWYSGEVGNLSTGCALSLSLWLDSSAPSGLVIREWVNLGREK